MNKFKLCGSKFYQIFNLSESDNRNSSTLKKILYSTSFNSDIVPLVHLHLIKSKHHNIKTNEKSGNEKNK